MCRISQQCGTSEKCCHVKHGHIFKVSIMPKQKAICCRALTLGTENSHMGLRLTSSLCHMIPGEYKFGPKDLALVQHLLQFCSSSCFASHLWLQHLLKMPQQLPAFHQQIQFADYCNHSKQHGGRGGREG